MNKENFKTISKVGITIILVLLFPAIISVIGLIALDNDITTLLIICIIISVYNIISLASKDIMGVTVSIIADIIYCITNNIEHPILNTILIVPLFFTVYYIVSFLFGLISNLFTKKK